MPTIPRVPLLSLAALVVLASACSDAPAPPMGPAGPEIAGPALATTSASGDYVIAVNGKHLGSVAGAIVEMGGEVVRSHADAGILIVSGLSDADATSLTGFTGVAALAADVMVDHPSAPTTPSMEVAPEAHDPSTAFFYQLGYQWDMEIIQADDAWAAGASAQDVTVAILDTGIDATHSDLAGLVDAGRSIAFVPNANPLIPAWGDDHYHGTHVAGTVASNGLGTAGVAPHATLMAVKICGAFFGCPFSAIISGILHAADNGADVINMSLTGFVGKSFPGGGELNALLNQVMNYASRAGVVVVSAAGNDGFDLQHLGRDFGAGSFVTVPCESGNGMCISATNVLDEPTSYTNYGTSAISMAAPGGDGLFPVLAPCSTQSVALPFTCGPNSYLWLTGTSMATPHVAGAAALVMAGGEKPGRVRSALQRTADDLGKPGTDPYYGKGRLNVLRAIGN